MSSFIEDPGVEVFEGLNLTQLEIDQAYLRINTEVTPVYLYTLSEECYGCPYRNHTTINEESVNLTISTKQAWNFLISSKNSQYIPQHEVSNYELCPTIKDVKLGEFGVYDIVVSNSSDCELNVAKDPVYEYGALIIALLVYLGIILIIQGYYFAKKRGYFQSMQWWRKVSETEEASKDASNGKTTTSASGKVRFKSLDTFRGIAIVVMIFVNYGAGQYWFLEHAAWNGLQVADLVFPWFMWIMGVCIPMGLRSQLKRNIPRIKIFCRILKRSLKLFFLGIILNSLGGWVNLDKYRVPGVLQRFGAAYLVTSSVALVFAKTPTEYKSKIFSSLSDVIYLLPQWIVYALIVTTHTCIVFLMPVSGCPTGYIGPGGMALMENGKPLSDCIGGATRQIDLWLVGESHTYQNPTAKFIYSSASFDPEGVLGVLTTIFQVFLGVQAGYILQFFPDHKSRIVRWFIWSVITGTIGTILTYGSLNDGPIPVNKNLWSLSFVMVTSCFAFFLLAVCYIIVDVMKWWSGSPFYQAGMNSIFLYVGHNVAYNLFPWHFIIGNMNTHIASLAECLWGTSLWVITALYLHSINKFYTV